MVAYIRSDLDFILAQIKIAEAHAAYEQGVDTGDPSNPAKPLFGPNGSIPAYNIAWGLRTVDGTYNHLLPGQIEWGASDNEFPEHLGTNFKTIMVPAGPNGQLVPVSYTPGVDNDGPGSAGPGDVFDPTVRIISNLLVDQTLGNPSAILTGLQRAGIVPPEQQMAVTAQISAAYQPLKPLFNAVGLAEREYAAASAAASASPTNANLQAVAAAKLEALNEAKTALDAADDALMTLLNTSGIELDGANVKITNSAPDEGLSAPFNSWFTLFGQFFDHGLDLIAKGGSGTVFIPLMPDDPLYVEGSHTNFMVLTRATLVGPGQDGILGNADDTNRPVNNTTSYVDQNQTYSSHPSHQVFLRQYTLNANGDPVSTGKLLEGSTGGMGTWKDLKEQAADLLGIQLVDSDVGNVPLLATDRYGEFIRGPNGYPQIVTTTGLVEGDPSANDGKGILVPANAIRTGHAFLADIAHNAVPAGLADGDIEIGLENPGNEPGVYDNELLDAHFVAGDGRANENIGLTAVHHVFHSEHNRLVEHTKAVVLADANDMLAKGASQAEAVAFLNEWLVNDVSTVPASAAGLVWDGERLFQAAKFGTEMQYQHLVFEEFARKIQPNINVFLVPDGFDTTIDPSIVAEFAHVVYRFGHSMLNESIDRFDPGFNQDHIGLIEGFLNPMQFQNNGGATAVDADIAAGAIIRGMTRQQGNEIDEFVTGALRNNLLGLPLDLATINLARGRDTGVPSLNEARAQFYAATNQDVLLKPYESWTDFAGHLKHEASIINFVAAYGTHSLITNETTIEGKRDAALTLITGIATGKFATPDFVMPTDRIDFLNATGPVWGADDGLGGLNDVDLWIGGLAEEIMPFGGMLGSTFNFVFEVQMEKLQNADRFYYLQRLDGLHLFGEMENNSFAAMIMRNTNATHLPSDVFSTPGLILEVDQTKQFNDLDGDGDMESADPTGGSILSPLVVRNNPATPGADTNYLRYNGGEHVVLGGTNSADTLIAGDGDDTLYGDGGKDRLEGGFGNDIINGGDGDDIIVDSGGDDNIKGGAGNDVVHAGPGLDLVLGGTGQDFIFLGTDMGSEVFAGEGNDFIYGNKNAERILGNEGNDWIETGTFDGAPGDNFDEVFAHDGIDGHDVFLGDGGFDEFIGEGGDDIMVGSAGRGKMVGMSGFDWATYKDNTLGVNADLSIPIVFDEAPTLPENAALDEYASVEGLSGTRFNDILSGTDDVAADRAPQSQGGTTGYRGSVLDAEGIALIKGLQELLGAGVTSFDGGDIILGGDGSDIIRGNGGNDIIDGDKWLDVQIGVFAAGDTNHTGTPIELHNSMTTLAAKMFNGTINPGQLGIVRTIRNSADQTDSDGIADVDYAIYSGVRSGYTFSRNADGSYTVTDIDVNNGDDGTDRVINIEYLRFADQDVFIANSPAAGAPTITGTENILTADPSGITDANGLGAFSYRWEFSTDGGANWSPIPGANQQSYTVPDSRIGQFIRVVVNFTDGAGNAESVASVITARIGSNSNNLADNLSGTTGPNLINGRNGNDTLAGLAGDDVINGGAGNDIITGAVGNDFLNGGSGNDNIDGGEGNDSIDGGSGTNTLSGGAGNDVFLYTIDGGGATSTINGGADIDTINVSDTGNSNETLNVTFSTNRLTLIEAATVAADVEQVVADLSNGDADTLEYSTASAGVTVDLGAGTASGFLSIAGIENVTGGNGADILIGNGAANVLNGRGGADTLRGLGGNDTYIVDNAGDVVDETAAGSGGLDAVETSLTTYTLSDGVENLTYTGNNAFTGNGNALNNVVTGANGGDTLSGLDGNDTLNGDAGNDTLNGGIGADTLNGGAGVDRMTGGDGADIFIFNDDETGTNANRDVIIDFVQGTDKIDIEAVDANRSVISLLTDQDFTFIGSNNFTGNGAGQLRYSQVGGQTIIEGRSLNFFGTGTTSFQIALNGLVNLTAADFIGLTNAPQPVSPQPNLVAARAAALTENAAAGTTVASLTTFGAEADGMVTYSLQGASSNLLEIQGSNIVLKQGAVLDFEAKRSHEVTVIATSTDGDTKQETFRFDVRNVGGSVKGTSKSETCRGSEEEDRIWTGKGNDVASSGNGNDQVYGEDGHDRLLAGAGNDLLNGGKGNDVLDGGSGIDRMWGGYGNDVYIVDHRSDRVYEGKGQGIDAVKSSVTYSLAGTQVEKLILTGISDINGYGNGLNNVLYGNAGDNVLSGGGGHDTLRGGAGADTFVFQKHGGRDVVTDFRHGVDEIDVSGLSGVNKISDLTVYQWGHDTVVKHGLNILVLKGVNASDLDSNDFIF